MTKWLFLALGCSALHAAIIRGVVLEHQTGRPLARALVVAEPVAGSTGTAQSVHTNTSGAFEFPPMPGGAYLVSASRRGFAPFQYGQKRWKASGEPVVLDDAATTFLDIRLLRFGSIAGTVMDENDVGLPEHDVIAYRNARPPVIAGRATTDDRGAYRIWGLEPGSYLIRTAAKQSEEGGYLPTFSREAATVDDAQAVEVQLDEQTSDANVRPAPGKLLRVAGRAYTIPPAQVTLTLMSDMGPEYAVSDGAGAFEFKPMAPGKYELYAEAPSDRRYGGGRNGAWLPLPLDLDNTELRINLMPFPELCISVEDGKGQPVDPRAISVLARRREPFGEGKPETLKPAQGCTPMQPGRWELTVPPMSNYYVTDFRAPGANPTDQGRPDGWNDLVMTGRMVGVKFVFAAGPGSVHGTVAGTGQQAVQGAPVFLEAWDPGRKKRLLDLRTTRTDVQGHYYFAGLAPGVYRVLSSFEFQEPDESSMETAKTLQVEQGRDVVQDLELYVMR
jgi:Carboxypeptidase regulatory-like domain